MGASIIQGRGFYVLNDHVQCLLLVSLHKAVSTNLLIKSKSFCTKEGKDRFFDSLHEAAHAPAAETGFTIFNGMSDRKILTASIQNARRRRDEYLRVKMKNRLFFIAYIFQEICSKEGERLGYLETSIQLCYASCR